MAKVYRLRQEGISIRDTSEKMKLSEETISVYVWRAEHPERKL